MSEFFPIQIRHLDRLVNPISGSDLFALQFGDEINGFETRAAKMSEVLTYVNSENSDLNVETLNASNSAFIANSLYVGRTDFIDGIACYIDGNTIISGGLSALSGITYFQTNINQTTGMFLSAASGSGLTVVQDFEFPIAQFFDSNNIALHIDGSSERAGFVGIGTTVPNEKLTIVGNVSSSEKIYSKNLNSETSYITELSAYNLYVIGSSFLESESGSSLNIGNLSSSNTNIVGNVHINTETSLDTVSTIIGNDFSDVFINGYLFTKNVSSNGNIYYNTLEGQNKEFNLGNNSAINNIIGTSTLSGNVYLNGDVIINGENQNNTYINTNDNTGVVFLGNSNNSVEVNSNNLTHKAFLTSDLIALTYTDYEFLTAKIDEIFNTSTIVYFFSTIDLLNSSITSIQYRILEEIESFHIDLNNNLINLGDDNFNLTVKGNNIDIASSSVFNLYALSGGTVNLGNINNSLNLEAFSLGINDDGGVVKNTNINSGVGSGDLYLGNRENKTTIEGFNTFINTVCSANTKIGHISGGVEITNLTVLNSFSALVDSFTVNNVFAQNINTSNFASTNNSNFNNIIVNQTAQFQNNINVNQRGIFGINTEPRTVVGYNQLSQNETGVTTTSNDCLIVKQSDNYHVAGTSLSSAKILIKPIEETVNINDNSKIFGNLNVDKTEYVKGKVVINGRLRDYGPIIVSGSSDASLNGTYDITEQFSTYGNKPVFQKRGGTAFIIWGGGPDAWYLGGKHFNTNPNHPEGSWSNIPFVGSGTVFSSIVSKADFGRPSLTVVGDISGTGNSSISGNITIGGNISALNFKNSNWDSTYSTVQTFSGTNWENSLANQYTNANFLPLSGGTLNGKLVLPASTTASAGLNIGTGTAPSAPITGDIWLTGTDIKYRPSGAGTRSIATLEGNNNFTAIQNIIASAAGNALLNVSNTSNTSVANAANFTANGNDQAAVKITQNGSANGLTVIGNISSDKNIFSSNTIFANYFEMSSVKLTSEVFTATNSITGTNSFIKVIVNGQNKYIRLFDI